ncbi:BTAD domain-containing putative transcriptional regulator [Nonomuraea sp. NPDC050790]|uniref:BTAD domain-containing putative transcriptional regulator n=1 Tax=Nonomuraea sp. NPDC050790 TaxID=3364371 RepID=UPI003795200E
MRFGVLGPLTVWTDAGQVVTIPGLKVRALLADLLAHDGRVVSTDRLVDDLWGDDAPANSAAALQVRVSQLRKALEDAEPGGKNLVVSRAPGYQLQVSPDAVDALRFARLAGEGRLAEALELWRGSPYADFSDLEFTRAPIAKLEERRLAALEELAEVRLAAGEPVDVAGLVAEHPLRERLRAVHMTALYRSGRQSDALATYGELRERLADELGLDPSPELADLHARILRQDPGLSGPAQRPVTNLPATVDDLIGRDQAVAEVRALLDTSRLVTLTGSGGVGKTRLSIATASVLTGAYPDGAWLVELAAYDRDTASLADAVLAALDIRDSAGPGDALDRLADTLRGRRMLLVLDNCEHVIDQAAKLAESLLRAAPGLRILATSREPLSVAGEALWSVPPLGLPEEEGLDAVAGSDAVRLFMARATASARGFVLDESTAGAVAQLCRRLDGLPLALELAATRVRSLGIHELVARLDDRFRVLSGWQRGVSDRQQTLMGMIDWSWTLLTEDERVVLRRLAVHADGCTLEAAEVVCGGGGLDVMELLARLVDRSLVTVVEGPAGVRYRLLESVAAYCRRRLDDAGETDAVRRAYVAYYTSLAERAEGRLRGGEQVRWMRRLDAEAANLRGALDAAPGRAAVRLVNALAWHWYLRGRLHEALRSLDTALSHPDLPQADRPEADGPEADRLQADLPRADGPEADLPQADGVEGFALEVAKARAWRAGFALLLGENVDWEAALEIADPAARARAELFVQYGVTDMPTATAVVDRALATCRELGDRWGVAVALSRQSRDAFTMRELDKLDQVGKESRRLFTELGDRWGVLQANEWLGGLEEIRGDYDEAVRIFTDDARVAEELGLWPDKVRRLSWLGWIATYLRDYDRGIDTCLEALRLADGQGYKEGTIFARMGLCIAARRSGRLELAEEHIAILLNGVPRGPDADPLLFIPTVLNELGHVRQAQGREPEARELFQESLVASRKIGDPRTIAGTMEALATVADPEEAARLLGAAAAARAAHSTPASPDETDDIARATTRARAALGDTAFTTAYTTGLTHP